MTTEEILLFRQAFAMLSTGFPFSLAFGLADSRTACVESSSALYDRLLKIQSNGELLRFETFLTVLGGNGGPLSKEQTRELVEVFRSNRRCELTRVEFVRVSALLLFLHVKFKAFLISFFLPLPLQSIDTVYREMRVLAANVENVTKMDSAYERLLNTAFYLLMGVVAFLIIGIDPFPFVLSLLGLLVAFAFVIGTASR